MEVEKVLLARPRGFCAGVEMAIKALAWMVEAFPPPVYCYHEIVHNQVVVDRFRALGVEFAVSQRKQDGLNPKGINCIRSMFAPICQWPDRDPPHAPRAVAVACASRCRRLPRPAPGVRGVPQLRSAG